MNILKHIACVVFCFAAFLSLNSQASTFNISGQLTGDPRVGNPSELFVDINIGVVDTIATWTIDINSPLHPNIKLDAFFFNLAINASEVSWSGLDPMDWSVSDSANNAPGSGSADFDFKTDDNPGKTTNITNSQNLTFIGTKTSNWEIEDFINAIFATSNDGVLGSGQMGAHLQALNVDNNTCPDELCSDSGFAFGNYQAVPIPAAAWLFGSGLIGLLGLTRRKVATLKAA